MYCLAVIKLLRASPMLTRLSNRFAPFLRSALHAAVGNQSESRYVPSTIPTADSQTAVTLTAGPSISGARRGRAHVSCVRSRSVLYPEVRKHPSQLPETFQSVAAVALAAASAVVDQTIKRSPKPEGPVHLLVQFGLRAVSSTLPKPCTHSGPSPLSPRYYAL